MQVIPCARVDVVPVVCFELSALDDLDDRIVALGVVLVLQTVAHPVIRLTDHLGQVGYTFWIITHSPKRFGDGHTAHAPSDIFLELDSVQLNVGFGGFSQGPVP